MAALIVGGDRVGNFKDYLVQQGYVPVRHWTGRNQSECHRTIPIDTRVVVVMVDQVNHGLAKKIRRAADEMAVPVVFSRRSVGQLSSALACVAA
ncbi:DUF2325 domain-containing protein [Dechloromonas denitrificans]|uniref:DUF2325 domain-containing protein n=1 Tax=Dechloromonas denitrificans TaxID=281362 RepID=UPI001CF90AA0|nr:DUF2325 domain-containing protein [Dechloromonas denitrificans]UCV05627.1 DUF2325 domain-containing protein [Dechloromonas denitrificans]